MNPIRQRWIVEVKGVDRRELADDVLKRLQATGHYLPAGVTADTPLDDRQQEAVKRSLSYWGKPDADVKTWGDALQAFTGDVDGDGKTDFDLDALTSSQLVAGAWAPTLGTELAATVPKPVAGPVATGVDAPPAPLVNAPEGPPLAYELQQTIAAGEGTVTIDPMGQSASLDVRLAQRADGSFEAYTGDPPPGGVAVGEVTLSVQGNAAQLTVGGQSVSAKPPISIKGFPPGTADAWVGKILAQAMPVGTPLASYQKQVVDQRKFELGPQPHDAALAVTWRAARVAPALTERAATQATAEFGVPPLKYNSQLSWKIDAPLARAVLDAAQPQQGVTPSYLHSIAMGEGLNAWFKFVQSVGGPLDKTPIDGFQYLGTDTFGQRAAQLKARHLLPEDFKVGVNYTVEQARNEKNQVVNSASFPSLGDGLTALGSLLADERRTFLRDAQQVLKPQQFELLTQDQINFFTYLYFNAGPGFGKAELEKHGLAYANKWTAPPPINNQVSARYNALQRASTWKYLQSLNIYPQ